MVCSLHTSTIPLFACCDKDEQPISSQLHRRHSWFSPFQTSQANIRWLFFISWANDSVPLWFFFHSLHLLQVHYVRIILDLNCCSGEIGKILKSGTGPGGEDRRSSSQEGWKQSEFCQMCWDMNSQIGNTLQGQRYRASAEGILQWAGVFARTSDTTFAVA